MMKDAWSNIDAKRSPIRRSSSSADEDGAADDDVLPIHARYNPLPNMMHPMSSSSPILIPAPPTARTAAANDGGFRRDYSQDSYSSTEDHVGVGVLGPSGLSAALGELTVGSLPSHLLRPQRGVGGGGTTSIRMQRMGMHQHRPNAAAFATSTSQFIGSSSLPPPRAPFLSSRGGAEERLSTMPEVTLPESAMASSTDNSIQYGSLRESRFMGGRSHQRGAGLYSSPRLPIDIVERNMGGDINSSNAGLTAQGQFVNDHDGGIRGASSEIAPSLIGSITALDILTRTKESQLTNRDATAGDGGYESASSNGKEASRLSESQRPFNDGVSPSENLDGGSSFDNYDQLQSNPDTFEAFDFELE
ncbi:hypothetical protein ACHAW5_001949 [Stephanodiscus triporus]|uniref:Uncharacterized protein n=1 Tax=Stephanodiscus triporus TaxID=2934178 RepID=A0ABD3N0L6_9STRA